MLDNFTLDDVLQESAQFIAEVKRQRSTHDLVGGEDMSGFYERTKDLARGAIADRKQRALAKRKEEFNNGR